MGAGGAVYELERPDVSTQRASSRLEDVVERAVNSAPPSSVTLVMGEEGVEIPDSVLRVLLYAVHEQAIGHRVRVIAPDSDDELTPNEAARYLEISRPLLVKLLNDGTIPARTLPGSRHRRIAVSDLEAYRARKSQRRQHLAAAVNEVAEAGLYLP